MSMLYFGRLDTKLVRGSSMVGLTVRGQQTDLEMLVKKGHQRYIEGEEAGFFGQLTTLLCVVKPSLKYTKYELIAEFNPDSPYTDGSKFSRGGFWAGVHDQKTKGKMGGRYFTSCEMESDLTGFQIDLTRWSWGTKPCVVFEKDENHSSTEKEIFLTFANRPFFTQNIRDVNDESEQVVYLRFTLWGWTKMGMDRQRISQINVKQRFHESQGEGDDHKIQFLREYGAFNLTGEGNSVHPKQVYTCQHISSTIKNDFPNKEKIRIGYIGPDTTENLRSVIRMLTSDATLAQKEYKLYVFYDEKWDIPTAFHTFEGTELGLEHAPLKPEPLNNNDLISGKEPPPEIDILIATYVGPWAVFVDEDSKRNYTALLGKIMGTNTKFITIDPSNSKNSVVSHVKPTEFYGDQYTLRRFYKDLQYDEEPLPWNAENAVVVCRKWTKGA